jgi:signal transduction histidine kinase/ActR/RegA family two-component response regulator
MAEDWRFEQSPHVAQGGLGAYAGVPLRFETEFGEHVAFGSLCVASNSAQGELSQAQQRSLAWLADWVVADIIHSARARRQRERRRMLELISEMQKQCDQGANMESVVLELIREVFPSTAVGFHVAKDGQIDLDCGYNFHASDLEHGLWEDCDYFDYMIQEHNHQVMVAPRTVRVIAAQCTSQSSPTYLVVGSRDFRHVFDDIDSWFVHMCATILSRYWQGHALQEALKAKDDFLRGITHQLRTPIHGILGSVELLTEELEARNIVPSTTLSSPETTPDMEQMDPYVYIKTIRTSARELISTVNSLIKLNEWTVIAQTERVTTLQRLEEIESVLVREMSLMLPDDVSARASIIIQHKFPPHCDSLVIDTRLFLDCIQPLVVNAVHNTAGGVVAVTMSITENFQSLIVDVEDNGCGIAACDHERIFRAYEKTDAHTIEAGLGLTLACKSASLMNGRISLVSSAIGRGSHFRAVFTEPTCASSLPLRISLSKRLIQLPGTFHRLVSHSRRSSLGEYLCRFLKDNNYTESATLQGSLVIVEYTPDLTRLYKETLRIPHGQVAICLVPEGVCDFIDFSKKPIQRHGNVVYVKGPFLPSTLEEALSHADATLANCTAVILNTESCEYNGVAVDYSDVTSTVNNSPEISPFTHLLFPSVTKTDLTQSICDLRLNTTASVTPFNSPSLARLFKPMTLLVDDNAINLRLLEMYCSRRGIPYRTARDGAEAVHLFSVHRIPIGDPLLHQSFVIQPFDLVLMDLQMPVCNGVEATQRIRTLEEVSGWTKSVVCIVTGQDSPADRSEAEDAGADRFLVKPVGPKVLDQCIRQWFPSVDV